MSEKSNQSFLAKGVDFLSSAVYPTGHKEKKKQELLKLKGATTIQQSARDSDDKELPSRQGKNVDRATWLKQSFGVDLSADVGATEQAAVYAVVKGAASRGRIKILQSLFREGLWEPSSCRTSIEAADEGGFLVDLLMNFCFRLSWYPSAAEDHEEEVVDMLHAAPDEADLTFALSPLQTLLTKQSCLLANFLLVNSPVAARVLEAVAEEMVVFRGDDFRPTSRLKRRPFPHSLQTLYIKRLIKEKEATDIVYSRENQTVRLPGSDKPTSTSTETFLTVPVEYREDVLIPLTAENFCFVYPCEALPLGGFLYIDTDGKDGKPRPLVVNILSNSPGQQAFSFGEPRPLNEAATAEIFKDIQDLPEDSPMREKGATCFAWITRELPGVGEIPLGGFAYTFKDPIYNRFFPLEAAGEVVRMANLSWDVTSASLSKSPHGDDIERHIAPRGEDKAHPVSIMRITTPGVLHPVMLHALAYTPREDVLSTDVAKAISFAAWQQAWPLFLSQFCADIISAVSLTGVTWVLRVRAIEGDPEMWTWKPHNIAQYAVLTAILAKNMLEEIALATGYWKCKWLAEYLNLNTLMTWTSMLLILASIVMIPTRQSDQGYVRTTLGICGWFKWIKIVSYLRGFMTLKLGMRILPILSALQEGAPFILVMMFFLAASTHFFFALSDQEEEQGWPEMGLLTYNLGFLGDFDLDEILGEDPPTWFWVQYGCFVLTSVLVMVSLTNIYIGVMGNAYDHNHDKAVELFVRARAAISLDVALQSRFRWHCFSRRNKESAHEEYVWFCKAAVDPTDVGGAADDGATSLRSVVRDMQAALAAQMEKLEEQVEELKSERRTGSCPGTRPGTSQSLVRPKSRG